MCRAHSGPNLCNFEGTAHRRIRNRRPRTHDRTHNRRLPRHRCHALCNFSDMHLTPGRTRRRCSRGDRGTRPRCICHAHCSCVRKLGLPTPTFGKHGWCAERPGSGRCPTREQSRLPNPMSQWQVPLKQVPCPVQFPEQPPRTMVQATPEKPGSHSQLRPRHTVVVIEQRRARMHS